MLNLLNSKWFQHFANLLGFGAALGLVIGFYLTFPAAMNFTIVIAPYIISAITTAIGIVLGSRISDERPGLEMGAVAGAAIGGIPVFFGLTALPQAAASLIFPLCTAVIFVSLASAAFAFVSKGLLDFFQLSSEAEKPSDHNQNTHPISPQLAPASVSHLSSSQLIQASMPKEQAVTIENQSVAARKPVHIVASQAPVAEELPAYPGEERRKAITGINVLVDELGKLLGNCTAINKWREFYANNSELAYPKQFTSPHWFFALNKTVKSDVYENKPRVKELFDTISQLIKQHNEKIDSSKNYFSNLYFTSSVATDKNNREIADAEQLRQAKLQAALLGIRL